MGHCAISAFNLAAIGNNIACNGTKTSNVDTGSANHSAYFELQIWNHNLFL